MGLTFALAGVGLGAMVGWIVVQEIMSTGKTRWRRVAQMGAVCIGLVLVGLGYLL